MKKNVFALLISLVVSVLLLEGFLHIYNPFAPRIQGNQIVLPQNRVYHIHNDKLKRLPPEIVHTKNKLGFRGENPPSEQENILSIICVGGSTTECYYLNDGQDWPAQLQKKLSGTRPNVWINNAGLDGHSTWGHSLLLQQHVFKLHPQAILMLCGVNDIGRTDISEYDLKQIKKEEEAPLSFKESLLRNSQILNTIRTIRMGLKAQQHGVNHSDLDLSSLDTLNLSTEKLDSARQSHKQMISAYGKRLELIIKDCQAHKTPLILMTQPMLWGNAIDPTTKVYLGNIKLEDNLNSLMRWEIMEAYNTKLREVAEIYKVPVIDLAQKLEKNYDYFYDEIHFTPNGSNRIAEIIQSEIQQYLQ